MKDKDREIVYIDMDGVLANFDKRARELIEKTPGIQWPQATYGFFESLDPMPFAIDSYNILDRRYDVYILSRPSIMNPWSYTGKRVWIEEHLGYERCDRLILSCHKHLSMGDYLIDDRIHEGFQGEHIHFGTKQYPSWPAVLERLG